MSSLLYWVHSMVKWYVVQCFQSAASAIWANRMKEKKAREGNESLSCKESMWTLGATHSTLSRGSCLCIHISHCVKWGSLTWVALSHLSWMSWTLWLRQTSSAPTTFTARRKGHPLITSVFFSQSFALFLHGIFLGICLYQCFRCGGWAGERKQIKRFLPF